MVPSAGSPFTLCKTNETSLFTIDKLRGCIFFQLVVIVILDAESFNRTTIILSIMQRCTSENAVLYDHLQYIVIK